MKTIHESIIEMLELMKQLGDNGIEVQILYKPQELLDVPDDVTESFAKVYLPMILEFYQNEDNMREYEQWKKTQEKAEKQTA